MRHQPSPPTLACCAKHVIAVLGLALGAIILGGCGALGSAPPVPTATSLPPARPPATATLAAASQAKPTAPPPTATRAPATPTPQPPRPTATRPPPTLTAVPRTATPIRPTSTPLPPTPIPKPAPSTGAACRPSGPVVTPKPGRSVAVDRGPAECPSVALTFDAGADRGFAEQILDTLRTYKAPASFGMTGQWAEKNADLVKRMADEGHHLINHTWSHRSFTGFSPKTRALTTSERLAELERTETFIKNLTGRSTKPYFRPPYGDLDEGVYRDVGAAGYDYTIMWTVDSLGWNHLAARAIIERCLSRAAPGVIYIFHVGAESQDAAALGPILDGLRARGLGFVTVEDMLGL